MWVDWAFQYYAGTVGGWRTDDDRHGRSDDIPAVDDTAEVTMIVDGTEIEVFFGDSSFFDTDVADYTDRRVDDIRAIYLGSWARWGTRREAGYERVELRKGR